MLIDTHCHLHDREFFTEKQAEEMLARAREKGVEKIICIGTSPEDSMAARDFAASHDGVYWTYGVHPEAASEAGVLTKPVFSSSGLEFLSTSYAGAQAEPPLRGEPVWRGRNIRVKNSNHFYDSEKTDLVTPAPIAIGEVGLDYHYEGYNRKAQIQLFEEMLQLATDNDLPVSFHVREAFEDFFEVIANFPKIRGVVHSFSDNKKNLKKILSETEFFIGVNGMATYSTLPTPPLERILLETDAPFLTPAPFRGIINESGYIYEIATWVSKKLDVSFEIVEQETTKNAEKLFRFDDTGV
ncbi:TatD family hydrolase [Candidatus Saccharibacteria bacterium]|nr:TatD family hydrolase [Candidatus Saccharibacteria bacterium]